MIPSRCRWMGWLLVHVRIMYTWGPQDGSVSSAIKVHAKSKTGHVLKFVSFIKKNNDIPFVVK